MTISNLDWWYDGQMRRFLVQMVRAFSGYQYQTGRRGELAPQLIMVPCRMATLDRTVGHIMRNLSENVLNTVPMVTVWQSGLTPRRDAIQYPGFIDNLQVTERAIDSSGHYDANRGNSYGVQRLMPRPFEMRVQVDIWTSNLDQKHQLAEQILTVVFPSFDIQNSQNPLDWTALTTMYLEEITWSSRTIPIGTESEIDVMSLQFRLPMWLSPPANVLAQKIIQQIVTNVYDGTALVEQGQTFLETSETLNQIITTPRDFTIQVTGPTITLLNQHTGTTLADASLPSWSLLLALLGQYQPGVSTIQLALTKQIDGAVVSGVFYLVPDQVDQITWQIDPDTLPANTLDPVAAVIEPLRTFPGTGLPSPAEGVRYLLLQDIGPSLAWGTITARANDIIGYHGGGWTIEFTAATTTAVQYVLNAYTGRQLRWDGQQWTVAIDGVYFPGYWRLGLGGTDAAPHLAGGAGVGATGTVTGAAPRDAPAASAASGGAGTVDPNIS